MLCLGSSGSLFRGLARLSASIKNLVSKKSSSMSAPNSILWASHRFSSWPKRSRKYSARSPNSTIYWVLWMRSLRLVWEVDKKSRVCTGTWSTNRL